MPEIPAEEAVKMATLIEVLKDRKEAVRYAEMLLVVEAAGARRYYRDNLDAMVYQIVQGTNELVTAIELREAIMEEALENLRARRIEVGA